MEDNLESFLNIKIFGMQGYWSYEVECFNLHAAPYSVTVESTLLVDDELAGSKKPSGAIYFASSLEKPDKPSGRGADPWGLDFHIVKVVILVVSFLIMYDHLCWSAP